MDDAKKRAWVSGGLVALALLLVAGFATHAISFGTKGLLPPLPESYLFREDAAVREQRDCGAHAAGRPRDVVCAVSACAGPSETLARGCTG